MFRSKEKSKFIFMYIHSLYQFTHLYKASVMDDLVTQTAYNKMPTKFSSSSIVSLAQVAHCYLV